MHLFSGRFVFIYVNGFVEETTMANRFIPPEWSCRMRMGVTPHLLWSTMAIGSAGLAVGSIVLTERLDLHPCHLCILQRLLFMILALLGGIAAWQSRHSAGRWTGVLSLPVSVCGVAVASYQSWLQAQPRGTFTCTAGQPGLIEQWIDWLGQRLPQLFMATGFCEDVELQILGLSLAHWALVAFSVSLAMAIGVLRSSRRDS